MPDQSDVPTLKQFIETWTPYMRRTVAASTAAQYELTLRLYVLPLFGHRRMNEIRRVEIVNAVRAWLAKPLRANTIRGCITVMRRVYLDAIDQEIVNTNPVVDVTRPLRNLAGKGEPIEFETIPLIVAALKMRDPQVADFCAFLYQTGLRLGEGLALRWEDVRDDTVMVRRTWHWRGCYCSPTKTRKIRVVHLTDAARLILVNRPRTSDWIWPDKRHDRPMSGELVQRCMRQVRARLVLPPHVRPHSLRHSYGTALIQADVNPRFVQQQMGHSSDALTRRYSERAVIPRPDHLDDALRFGPVSDQQPRSRRSGLVIVGPWRRRERR